MEFGTSPFISGLLSNAFHLTFDCGIRTISLVVMESLGLLQSNAFHLTFDCGIRTISLVVMESLVGSPRKLTPKG